MTAPPPHVELAGYSVGGFATTIDLPRLKVAVDMGMLLDAVVARERVLVTHGHADHVGSLAQHAAQRGLRRLGPARYHVPPGLGEQLERLLALWRAMDGGALAADIVETPPDRPFDLRPGLQVTPFATVHRVPSQGYLFEEVKRRLRPAFAGASAARIVEAKARGEAVDDEVRAPLLAVSGDTCIDGVLGRDDVLSARTLALEATFLDDRVSVAQAREMGHVHLAEIARHADAFRCERLLLYHVSPRHGEAQARRLVDDVLPADLAARTEVWVGGR